MLGEFVSDWLPPRPNILDVRPFRFVGLGVRDTFGEGKRRLDRGSFESDMIRELVTGRVVVSRQGVLGDRGLLLVE
jgi:hypothetical protein